MQRFRPVILVLSALLTLMLCYSAAAQEFRIYTRVYNEQGAEPQTQHSSTVLARSLTLFHAGRAYDYVNAVGEVLIFDPAHRRFIILHTQRKITTTLGFDELEELVDVGRQETVRFLKQPIQQGGPRRDVAAALEFQLNPDFEETFDTGRRRLTLRGPRLQYNVRCAPAETPEALESYLRYADWIRRLDYVLHPQSLFPAPRLALNEALRKQGQIPVEVELQAHVAHRVHLRAEHQIHWQLDATDRSLIHEWESLLKDERTERVSFRDYQRAVLVSELKGR